MFRHSWLEYGWMALQLWGILLFFNLFFVGKKQSRLKNISILALGGLLYLGISRGQLPEIIGLFLAAALFLLLYSGYLVNQLLVLLLFIQLQLLLIAVSQFFLKVTLAIYLGLLVILNLLQVKKTLSWRFLAWQNLLLASLLVMNGISLFLVFQGTTKKLACPTSLYLLVIGLSFILFLYCLFHLKEAGNILKDQLRTQQQLVYQRALLQQNQQALKTAEASIAVTEKNIVQLQELLAAGESQQAQAQLQIYFQSLANRNQLEYTGNQLIDSVIYAAEERCRAAGIRFSFDFSISKRVQVPDFELLEVLAQLLDYGTNHGASGTFLTLRLFTKKQFLVIELCLEQKKGRISQQQLLTIQRCVTAFQGIFSVTKTGQRIKVLLPNSS